MIVAIILALAPVALFVLLILFSDLGGNEPTLPPPDEASVGSAQVDTSGIKA